MQAFFQWIIDSLRELKLWFTVDPWEKAVRVRLGKHTKLMGPGFHFKAPLIDQIYVVNTRLRLSPTAAQTVSTTDGAIITIGIQLGFSIIDPLLALNSYQSPEDSLATLIQNHTAEYINGKSLAGISINELEEFVLNNLLDSNPDNGMQIEFVKVTTYIASGKARTFRLVNDEAHVNYGTIANNAGTRFQPHVIQW